MLVDRHLEPGTPVPQVRIKIDAQIIFRHHLETALVTAGNDAISRLPSAARSVGCRFRLAPRTQLPRPLTDDLRPKLTGKTSRSGIGTQGEWEDSQLRKRQGELPREGR